MKIKTVAEIRQEIKAREEEARADAAEARHREQEHRTELDAILRQIPTWRKWYLKKNQPKNYFRVTCTKPPGLEDNPHAWICKFQVWVRGQLNLDYRITVDAWHFFSTLEDWREDPSNPGWFKHQPQTTPQHD